MEPSSLERWARRLLWIYPVLLLLCGIGLVRFDTYQLDGDAVSFMDIASAMLRHDWALVPNGYWNPLYAVVLAIGLKLAHPTRFHELLVFYWCNFVFYCAAFGACAWLLSGLLQLRRKCGADANAALSAAALYFFGLTTLLVSFLRELSLAKVRSDALLLTCFFLAAGTLVRVQVRRRFYLYPLLGLFLGLAYLTKSYAMLPSAALLLALGVAAVFGKSQPRGQAVAGVLVAAAVYGAIAVPFVVAISKQRGYFTTGESARINYAFFVDDTDRWHEWHSGKMGRALGNWKHHEDLLSDNPAIFSYRKHPQGTFPLWFDPSYWTQGLTPKVYLPGHIRRLVRTTELLTRFLLERPETLLLLLLLIAIGARAKRPWRTQLPMLSLVAWGLLMIAIYMPIDLQDRYTSFAYMLVLFPIAALLQADGSAWLRPAALTATMAVALAVMGVAFRDLAQTHRVNSVTGVRPAYSSTIYPVAEGLIRDGVGKPGDTVACMGEIACYPDVYWARLANVQIENEIEVPSGVSPLLFWNSLPNREEVLRMVKQDGAKAIVTTFPSAVNPPEGWQSVPGTDFFIYPLS